MDNPMDQCKCCRKVHNNITLTCPWVLDDEDDDEEFLKSVLEGVSTADIETDSSLSWFDDLTERQRTTQLLVHGDSDSTGLSDSSGPQIWSPYPRGGRSDVRCDPSVTPKTDPLSSDFGGETPSIIGLESSPHVASSPSLEQLAADQSDVKWTSAMATPPYACTTSYNDNDRLSDTSLDAGDITTVKVKVTHRKLFSPGLTNVSYKTDDSLLHLSDLDITKETDITIIQEDEEEVENDARDQTLRSTGDNVEINVVDDRRKGSRNKNGENERRHIETVLNSLFCSPVGSNETDSSEDVVNGQMKNSLEIGGQIDDKDAVILRDVSVKSPMRRETMDNERKSDDCGNNLVEPDHMSDSLCLSALLDEEKVLIQRDSDRGVKTELGRERGKTVKKLYQSSANDENTNDSRTDSEQNHHQSLLESNDDLIKTEGRKSSVKRHCNDNSSSLKFVSSSSRSVKKAFVAMGNSEKKSGKFHTDSAVKCNPLSILKTPNTPKSNHSRNVRFSLPDGDTISPSVLAKKGDMDAQNLISPQDRGKTLRCDMNEKVMNADVHGIVNKRCNPKAVDTLSPNTVKAVSSIDNDGDSVTKANSMANYDVKSIKYADNDINHNSNSGVIPHDDLLETYKNLPYFISDTCEADEDLFMPSSPTFSKGVAKSSKLSLDDNIQNDDFHNVEGPSKSNPSLYGEGEKAEGNVNKRKSLHSMDSSHLEQKEILATLDSTESHPDCIKKLENDFNFIRNSGAFEIENNSVKRRSEGTVESEIADGKIPVCSIDTFSEVDPVDSLLMAAYDVSSFTDSMVEDCHSDSTKEAIILNERSFTHGTESKGLKPVPNTGERVSSSSLLSSSAPLISSVKSSSFLPCVTSSSPFLTNPVSSTICSSSSKLTPSSTQLSASLLEPSNSPTAVISISVISNSPKKINPNTCVIDNIKFSSNDKIETALSGLTNKEPVFNCNSSLVSTISSSFTSLSMPSPSVSAEPAAVMVTVSSASHFPIVSTRTTPSSFNVKPRKFFYPKTNKTPGKELKINSWESNSKSLSKDIPVTSPSSTASVLPTSSLSVKTPSSTASRNECKIALVHGKDVASEELENMDDDKSNLYWSREVQHLFDDDGDDNEMTRPVKDSLLPTLTRVSDSGMCERQVENASYQTNKSDYKRKSLPKLLGFARFSDMFGNSTESETNKEGICDAERVGFSKQSMDSSKPLNDTSIANAQSDTEKIRIGCDAVDLKDSFLAGKQKNTAVSESEMIDDENDTENPMYGNVQALVTDNGMKNEALAGIEESRCDLDGKYDDKNGREVESHLEGISSHVWDLTGFSQISTPDNERLIVKNEMDYDNDENLRLVESDKERGGDISCPRDCAKMIQQRDKDENCVDKGTDRCENGDKSFPSISIQHQQNVKNSCGGLKRSLKKSDQIHSGKRQKLETSSKSLSGSRVSKLKIFDDLFFSNEMSTDSELSEKCTGAEENVEDEFEKVLAGLNGKSTSSFPDKSNTNYEKFKGFQRASDSSLVNTVRGTSEINRGSEKDLEEEFEKALTGSKAKLSLPKKIRGMKCGDFVKGGGSISMTTDKEISGSNQETEENSIGSSESCSLFDEVRSENSVENQLDNLLAGLKAKSPSLSCKNKKILEFGKFHRDNTVVPAGKAILISEDSLDDQFENMIARIKSNDSLISNKNRFLSKAGKRSHTSGKNTKSDDVVDHPDNTQTCDGEKNGGEMSSNNNGFTATSIQFTAGWGVDRIVSEQAIKQTDEISEHENEECEDENQLSIGIRGTGVSDSEESERILKNSKNYYLRSEEFVSDCVKSVGGVKVESRFRSIGGEEIKLSDEAQMKSAINSQGNVVDSLSEEFQEGNKFRESEAEAGITLGGFCTARGKEIKLSKEAKKKASTLWDSVCSENTISDSKCEPASCMSEMEGKERGDKKTSCLQGFVTAGGRAIALSEEAKKKAECLWESIDAENDVTCEQQKSKMSGMDFVEDSVSKVLDGSTVCDFESVINNSKRKSHCEASTSKSNQQIDKRHKGFRPFLPPKMIKKKTETTSTNDQVMLKSDLGAIPKELDLKESIGENREQITNVKADEGMDNVSGFSNGLSVSFSEKAFKNPETFLNKDGNSLEGKMTTFGVESGQDGLKDDNVDEHLKCVKVLSDGDMANRIDKSEGKESQVQSIMETRAGNECQFDDEFDTQFLAELDLNTTAVERDICTDGGDKDMQGVGIGCGDCEQLVEEVGLSVPTVDHDRTSEDAELMNCEGLCDSKKNDKESSVVNFNEGESMCGNVKNTKTFQKPFFDFSTAAGSVVSVSEKALEKARSFLSEDGDTATTESSVNQTTFSSCDETYCKISDNSNVFSTVAGSKVLASEKTYVKVGNFSNSSDEEMMKLTENEDVTDPSDFVEVKTAKANNFIGFSTAAAESKVSETVDKENPNCVFSSVDEVPVTENSETDKKDLVDKEDNKPTKTFFGFTTAAGSKVSISEKALKKAKNFLNDDDGAETSLLTGTRFSDQNKLASSNAVCENSVESVVSSRKDSSEITLKSNDNRTPYSGNQYGFSTAAGDEVSISEKALIKARSFLNDDEHPSSGVNYNQGRIDNSGNTERRNFIGFSTAAGSEVSVSNEALEKAKSFLNDVGDDDDCQSGKFVGFSTASGLDVSVSKTSLEHARTFLKDDCEGRIGSSGNTERKCFIGFSTAAGSEVSVSNEALGIAKSFLNDVGDDDDCQSGKNLKSSKFVGFSTASGLDVSVSKTSLEHARTFLKDDCEDEVVKGTIEDGSEDNVVSEEQLSKDTKTPSAVTGTLSDSDARISIKALEQAEILLHGKENWKQDGGRLNKRSEEESARGLVVAGGHQQQTESLMTRRGIKPEILNDCSGARKRRLRNIHFNNSAREQTLLPQLSTSNTASSFHGIPSTTSTRPLSSSTTQSSSFIPPASTKITNHSKVADSVKKICEDVCVADQKVNILSEKGDASIVLIQETLRESMIVDDGLNDEEENKFLCENISTQIGCGSVDIDAHGNTMSSADERINNRGILLEDSEKKLSCGKEQGSGHSNHGCGKRDKGKSGDRGGYRYNADNKNRDSCGRSVDGSIGVDKAASGGSVDNAVGTTSALTEARMRQEKIIRDKKRRRIIPRRGRLMEQRDTTVCAETRNGNAERNKLTSLDGWRRGRRLTREELLCQGVSESTLSISSGNAAAYQFDLRQFYPGGVPTCILVGDGASLVHDGKGFAGCQEFYTAFLTLDGVDPNLVDVTWVRNQYRWIVWKLAAYEVCFPVAFAGRALTPDMVMFQMKYRCDREVDRAQRSAIKKIVEKDDTSTKRMVLCVAAIRKDSNGQFLLEMTDGWYSIWSKLDTPLSDLVTRSRLTVGDKIVTSRAELEGVGQGCSPLEMGEDVRLSLRANSTRPAPWFSRLGFQFNPMSLCVPICSLHPDGGMVGCVDVVVSRIYPTMFMEKQGEGKCVFRTQEEEDEERKKYGDRREREVEKIYHSLQMKMEEEEEKRDAKMKRRSWSRREVEELSTGEELLNAWETSFNQEDLQMLLSEDQLRKLFDHRQECVAERQARMNQRVRESIGDCGTHQDRRVMPVQKLRVVGCCNKDIDLHCETMLTVWRPSDDWHGIQEGQRYRMFHLAVSSSRWNTGHHQQQHKNACKVALASTRQTRIQKLLIQDNLLDLVYQSRELLTVREMSSLNNNSEFDFLGVAVKVEPPANAGVGGQGKPLLITSVDKRGDVMVIKMWKWSQSILSSVKENHCFVALNLTKVQPRVMIGRGRMGIASAEARQETTSFSTSVGGKHGQALAELQEHLDKTPAFLEKAKGVVNEDDDTLHDEGVTYACRAKSPVPDTLLDNYNDFFGEDYDDDFPQEIVDTIFHQLTPNGSLRHSPSQESPAMATKHHTPQCGGSNSDMHSKGFELKQFSDNKTSQLKLVQNHANITLNLDSVDEKCSEGVDSGQNRKLTDASGSKSIEKLDDEEVSCSSSDYKKKFVCEENVRLSHGVFGKNNGDENDKGEDCKMKSSIGSRSRLKRKKPGEEMEREDGNVIKRVRESTAENHRREKTGTIGDVVDGEDTPEEGDLVLKKRKKNLRDKMTKLLSYGRPQALTPLPGTVVSPACVKQFKSPHSSSIR